MYGTKVIYERVDWALKLDETTMIEKFVREKSTRFTDQNDTCHVSFLMKKRWIKVQEVSCAEKGKCDLHN